MPWTFADSEDALTLYQRANTDHIALLGDKPRRALERMRDYCEALAILIEHKDGLLQDQPLNVSPPPPPPPAPKQRLSGATQSCIRGVHSWGPIDDKGWASCTACGQVSITGGSAGKSGAFDIQPRTAVEMP